MNNYSTQTQPSMALANLLAGIVVVDPIWDRNVSGITLDSRQVKPGDLFIACVGTEKDGRQYILDAIQKGARAVVAEDKDHIKIFNNTPIPIFYAPDLPVNVGKIASRYYHHPSRRMNVIGITGTNGKTSCSHFLASSFHSPENKCAVIGTVGNGIWGHLEPSLLTTPDAVQLQMLLADFVNQGVKTLVMEASSHALAQDRVKHVDMRTAIFTNLTRDHLDYHLTMKAYFNAKRKLFEKFGLCNAVLNHDDPYTQEIKPVIASSVKIYTYSTHEKWADVFAKNIVLNPNGIKADIKTPWGEGLLESTLLGRFNVSNLLAVLTTLCCNGIELQDALQRIKKIKGVLGRMQTYAKPGSPLVIIDYAHTPDALQNALQAIRDHVNGKVWCIFGCGGNRDPGKRPLMGKIAETSSDHVIITDDNPRLEDPKKIVSDILSGFSSSMPLIEHDRHAALALALKKARPNDCILLAGKGHESYQQIGDRRISQSDQTIVEEALSIRSPLPE